MVLIDPTWKLRWLREHSVAPRHALFSSVGQKLVNDSDNDDPTFHPLSQTVEPAERALLCIMQAVAGVDARARVQAFLDQFAEKVHVRKPPN